MRECQPLHPVSLQLVNRRLDPFRGCMNQVHAADYRQHRSSMRNLLHVSQGADHARMRTTQDDDDSAGRLQDQGLVVDERIGLGTGGIQEETAPCIFQGR